MWRFLIILNLGALHSTDFPLVSAFSSPGSPINVSFSSVNLKNTLQWFPGNRTSVDTHFTVQYLIYGETIITSRGRRENWRPVRHCTDIVWNWCDLTNETWDLDQGYYARVRALSRGASSKWAATRWRFDPKTDTSFGPPLLSVEIEDNSALVTLMGPMRHQSSSRSPAVSMATLYPQMIYNLSIHNTHLDQMRHFQLAHSRYKYQLMEYDTEYCFSAKTRFLSMPIKCQSSAWHCITTPQDPVIGQLRRVVVGIVVPSLCMCMCVVVGYLLYHYLTGKGQRSPNILEPPSFHHPPLTFPPEKPNLTQITVIKEHLPSDTGRAISGRASPERPEPPLEDDLSVDYGAVAIASKTDDEGEMECCHNVGEDWCNPKCVARVRYKTELGDTSKATPYFPHKSAYTCTQNQERLHTQTEVSSLAKVHGWSQVYLTQTQAPLAGAGKGEWDTEKEDRERPSGLFQIPLNPPTKEENGMGKVIKGKLIERTDWKMDEESESPKAPLLSAYASQSNKGGPTSHTDQSDVISDEYGVLLVRAEEMAEEAEEEEERSIFIGWDPKTRKLVLPKLEMAFNELGEDSMKGEKKEVEVMNGELKLESVFVRQASEEEARAQPGTETGWGVDDFISKWNLVISMDQ